eukprot:GHRR01019680.1.p1 GENE.GHRR01019680.1~~GHRR01019680.1.p1  ORF type:complete len:236 (+),score=63.32 GHRR01019680.1:164-871(+)
MRPLWFEFPSEKELFAVEEEFMLGPAILVKPVLQPHAQHVQIRLPQGAVWYEALGGARFAATQPGKPLTTAVHLDAIPVFYRGGHIVPRRDRPRRSTATMLNDPFTLMVALDKSGSATGDLYLDDGRSFAFTKGQYLHKRLTYKDGVLSSHAMHQPTGTPEGTLTSKLLIEKVIILGLPVDSSYSASSGGKRFSVLTGVGVDTRLAKGSAAVVRAVNLPVAADWSIHVTEGTASM